MTPDVGELARILSGGGVALLPTDTIYGLHAVATNAEGVGKLVAIKGREDSKPFVVLGLSSEQLEGIGAEFSAGAREALADLWPGPLTVIVPLAAPIAASRGASTLAVRVPALPWMRTLLEKTGPLASTSVNRSGEPPLRNPLDLSHDLQESIDALYDAGRIDGEPSTIVELTGDEPRLIREGEPFFTQKVWKRLRKSL